MSTSVTIVDDSMELAPRKLKNRPAQGSSNPMSGFFSKIISNH